MSDTSSTDKFDAKILNYLRMPPETGISAFCKDIKNMATLALHVAEVHVYANRVRSAALVYIAHWFEHFSVHTKTLGYETVQDCASFSLCTDLGNAHAALLLGTCMNEKDVMVVNGVEITQKKCFVFALLSRMMKTIPSSARAIPMHHLGLVLSGDETVGTLPAKNCSGVWTDDEISQLTKTTCILYTVHLNSNNATYAQTLGRAIPPGSSVTFKGSVWTSHKAYCRAIELGSKHPEAYCKVALNIENDIVIGATSWSVDKLFEHALDMSPKDPRVYKDMAITIAKRGNGHIAIRGHVMDEMDCWLDFFKHETNGACVPEWLRFSQLLPNAKTQLTVGDALENALSAATAEELPIVWEAVTFACAQHQHVYIGGIEYTQIKALENLVRYEHTARVFDMLADSLSDTDVATVYVEKYSRLDCLIHACNLDFERGLVLSTRMEAIAGNLVRRNITHENWHNLLRIVTGETGDLRVVLFYDRTFTVEQLLSAHSLPAIDGPKPIDCGECCVCIDTIQRGVVFPCKHYSCDKCFVQLMKCPLCRLEFTVENLPKFFKFNLFSQTMARCVRTSSHVLPDLHT